MASRLYRKIVLHEGIDEDEILQIKATPAFSFHIPVHSSLADTIGGPACSCAFRHEYFSHIEANGNVDHEKLDLLCVWLDESECPHVSLADDHRHDIMNSSVSPLHVAIAADNERVWSQLLDQIHSEPSDQYKLTNVQIAVLKQRHFFMEPAKSHYSLSSWRELAHAKFYNIIEITDDDRTSSFIVQEVSAVTYSIEKNDIQLLNFFDTQETINRMATEAAILSGNNDILYKLMYPLKLDDPAMSKRSTLLHRFTLLAVLKSNINILWLFAYDLISDAAIISEKYEFNALDLALMIGDKKMANFLSKYLKPNRDADHHNPYQIVLDLTRDNPDPSHCIDLLRQLHERGHDINKIYIDGDPVIMSFQAPKVLSDERTPEQIIHPRIFAELLRLGADVNVVGSSGSTLLLECLMSDTFEDRLDVLKLCLYHNATIDHQKEVLYAERALCIDCSLFVEETFYQIPNYPQMTLQLDPPDISFSSFVFTLLWACGLNISEHILTRMDIPGTLLQFILEKISQPRSLRMICRNTIREIFPGRCLHELVRELNIPEELKEYILMSRLLLPTSYRCKDLPPVLSENELVTYSTHL